MAGPPPPHTMGRRIAGTLAAGAIAIAASLGPGAVSALAEDHDVSIVGRAFDPVELTVAVGDPVTWTNADGVSHTVTSDEGSELDSGTLGSTEAFGHVFEAPGTYPYHCEIHASMHGVVAVVAAAASPSGSAEPTPPSGTLPPGFSPATSTDAAPTASSSDAGSPAAAPSSVGTPAPSSGSEAGTAGNDNLIGPAAVALALLALAVLLVVLVVRRGRPG